MRWLSDIRCKLAPRLRVPDCFQNSQGSSWRRLRRSGASLGPRGGLDRCGIGWLTDDTKGKCDSLALSRLLKGIGHFYSSLISMSAEHYWRMQQQQQRQQQERARDAQSQPLKRKRSLLRLRRPDYPHPGILVQSPDQQRGGEKGVWGRECGVQLSTGIPKRAIRGTHPFSKPTSASSSAPPTQQKKGQM